MVIGLDTSPSSTVRRWTGLNDVADMDNILVFVGKY